MSQAMSGPPGGPNFSMNLFGGMDPASFEVGQPFVNIRLRPGKIGTVERLLVEASILQQYLDSLFD